MRRKLLIHLPCVANCCLFYDVIVKIKCSSNTCVFSYNSELCTDVGLHAAFTSICTFASNVYIFFFFSNFIICSPSFCDNYLLVDVRQNPKYDGCSEDTKTWGKFWRVSRVASTVRQWSTGVAHQGEGLRSLPVNVFCMNGIMTYIKEHQAARWHEHLGWIPQFLLWCLIMGMLLAHTHHVFSTHPHSSTRPCLWMESKHRGGFQTGAGKKKLIKSATQSLPHAGNLQFVLQNYLRH